MYDSLLGPQAAKLDGETQSDNIEQALFTVAGGQLNEASAKPVPISGASGISYPLFINNEQLDPLANNPTTARQDGITTIPGLKAAWDKGNRAKLAAMQDTEQFVADNIVTRATQLQTGRAADRAHVHHHHRGRAAHRPARRAARRQVPGAAAAQAARGSA